jgi:hypothetical protein
LLLLVACLALGCRAVLVEPGVATQADVAAPLEGEAPLNILGIGVADADGRILLRTTGVSVARGSMVQLGVMGPGMIEGTAFLAVGVGLELRPIRFAMTEGGGGASQPAAVLLLTVPADTRPGLYSVVAYREGRMSVFSGGLEVI